MLRAHDVDDVRAAESALMARLPDGELMRRAARGLADALDHVPAGEVLLVLVGPGDNGGDALLAAAHLLDRGVRVDLCLLDTGRVHEAGLAAALDAGARIVDHPAGQRFVLDGLLGIGARAGLSGRAAELAGAVEGADVTAVDVPSGLDVDSGEVHGPHVVADRTVTFGTYKASGLVDPAASVGGGLPLLVDIGLGADLPEASLEAVEAHDGSLVSRHLFTGEVSHKYTRGVVGVAAGSAQYAGAAHLCVAGAQAGPAGMVRYLGDDEINRRVVDRAPEVVAATEPGRCQAWVVGPGTGDDARARLDVVLEQGVPVVVDADALAVLPRRMPVPALLTPHAGELARMLDVDREEVEARPLAHARHAADRWGCTVLLKGERTLVATPGRPTRVNLTGTPWLGTAGSGDVLAGLAGSLLAAGLDAHDAGSVAAYLHGLAGQRVNPGGPFTATDVAGVLPVVLADFLRSA